MLRSAGLPISPEQTMDFTRALTLVNIGSREEVYHAARSLLVTRKEQLTLFQTIFNRFWRAHTRGEWPEPQTPQRKERPPQQPFDVVSYMAHKTGEAEQTVDVVDKSGAFSAAEQLQRKDFARMTNEELDAVKRLIQEMRWKVSLRQTRRRVAARKGRILHLRRVLRSAAKFGGAPLDLSWQDRKIKQRPLVLIADISGSMEKYARIMLQFAYSVSHSLQDVEIFLFGTRLTRVTPQLKLKNIDRAIDDAARQVLDWSGGTRIGQSLRVFNRRWSRRVLRRGAIVLIVSDGWERGDVSQLRNEMRYLQHRCHRLIWLNPLSGKRAYEPRVEGMAVALPFVDDFLPIDNLQSLRALSRHLSALGQQRSQRSQVAPA
jgi:uncharacterized protein with von Willebrand factor type A (vWA) domain